LARSSRRGIKATADVLGDDVEVVAYARGRARPRLPAWLPAAAFVYVALVGFATVVFPTSILAGLVLAVVVACLIWPRRAVAVADGQLALLSRSNWTHKHALISLLPGEDLRARNPKGRGRVEVALASDVVTLKESDLELLATAVGVPLGTRRSPSAATGKALRRRAATASGTPGEAAASTPSGFWTLVCVGAALVVGGACGAALNHSAPTLSQDVVSSPSSGMVPTAIGNGGRQPTEVLPAPSHLRQIDVLGGAPLTPTIILAPVRITHFGAIPISLAAYWKVWWDGNAQLKAVVGLQQHADIPSAQNALAYLATRIRSPKAFSSSRVQYTGSSSFTVTGIPGAVGYVWDGVEGTPAKHIAFEVRIAGFYRGSDLAVVSMTSYGTRTNPQQFLAFAQAEYGALGGPFPLNRRQLAFLLVLLFGLGALALAIRRKSRVAPAVPSASRYKAPRDTPARAVAAPAKGAEPGAPAAHSGTDARPAGWYVDPTVPAGREPFRYWDGKKWIDDSEDDRA
jgi:hypothetical protein